MFRHPCATPPLGTTYRRFDAFFLPLVFLLVLVFLVFDAGRRFLDAERERDVGVRERDRERQAVGMVHYPHIFILQAA